MISEFKKLYWQLTTQLRILKNRHIPTWLKYAKIHFNIWFNAKSREKSLSKNMLLLTWEFPPQVTGGVYRPTSWTKYAGDANWAVTVLCSQSEGSPSAAGTYLEHSIPQEVKIQRIYDQSKGPHPWPLPCIDGGLRNALNVYETARTLMDTQQSGVLVASGPPFHNFVAAMWLAKQYGWSLVLDYRDEWNESPFTFVHKDQPNLMLEKRCLQAADLVVFTTESQRTHAIESFSELNPKKCVVVYNGWEPNDFVVKTRIDSSTLALNNDNSIIKIAYLGNFGPMANPQNFLTALSKVLDQSPLLKDRIKFLCIGYKSPEALEQLSHFKYQNVLELIDQLPKQEACQIMKSVDLLLILNPLPIQRYIQGKLYEYIASGTPVLVFGKGGEMADIVATLDAGIVVDSQDESELSKVFKTFNPQTHPQKSAKIDQWLKSRQRNKLASDMFGQLDKLIQP